MKRSIQALLIALIALAMSACSGLGSILPGASSSPSSSITGKAPTVIYAALGDSVAAGVGLPFPDTSQTGKPCDRTNSGYANIVAKANHWQLHNFSCSGAKATKGLLLSQPLGDGHNASSQLSQLANLRPQEVSLTVGADDVDWSKFIKLCLIDICKTPLNAAFKVALASFSAAFVTALAKIAFYRPLHIVVTTYYDPFGGISCKATRILSPDNQQWISARLADLNTTISNDAAHFSRFHVRVARITFAGHEYCAPKPDVQNLKSKFPLHPTVSGDEAYAKVVEAAFAAQ